MYSMKSFDQAFLYPLLSSKFFFIWVLHNSYWDMLLLFWFVIINHFTYYNLNWFWLDYNDTTDFYLKEKNLSFYCYRKLFSVSFLHHFFFWSWFPVLSVLLSLSCSLKRNFSSFWVKGEFQCANDIKTLFWPIKSSCLSVFCSFKTFDRGCIDKYCHVCFPVWKWWKGDNF